MKKHIWFSLLLIIAILGSCKEDTDSSEYPCALFLTVAKPTLDILLINQAGDSLVGFDAKMNPDSIFYEWQGASDRSGKVGFIAPTRAIRLGLDYKVKQELLIHFPDGEHAKVGIIMKPTGPCWLEKEIAGVSYNNRLLPITLMGSKINAQVTAIK